MHAQIQLGGLSVDVLRKDIKNVHLSVHPPTGRVTISAPSHMSLDTIRVFAVAKLPWIRQHQQKLQEQTRETPREYLNRESHYVWGRRYLLKITEADEAPSVELAHRQLHLTMRPGTDPARRQEIIEDWYREQLRQAVPPIIRRWEPILGVRVSGFFVQRMKTKWGSCNAEAGTIRLNTDLARKPAECLEYLVVHEMTHLLERRHNERFVTLMHQFMPRWRSCQQELNRLPVRHEEWRY